MTTLHIENTVHDYEAWKAAFDKFDRFRADNGVRAYRIARRADAPNEITVDLDFDTLDEARSFRVALERIWATPQSRDQLVSHREPELRETVATRAY